MSGGRAVNADHIVVSSGSKQSLFNACFTLFGPGQRVLIPAPAWVSYPQIVHLSRAEPVLVPGDVEWGLKVSVRDLDAALQPGGEGARSSARRATRPGRSTRSTELKAIAEWAHRPPGVGHLRRDLPAHQLRPGAGAVDARPARRAARAHRASSTARSKAYAMTGWRIGAALAPPHVAKAMAALQSHTTTGANHPAQWAAATAFSDERVDQDVTRMVAAFRRRRDYLVSRFRTEVPGVEFVEPHGAFYFFFRVDGIREPAGHRHDVLRRAHAARGGGPRARRGLRRRSLGAHELRGVRQGARGGGGPHHPASSGRWGPPVPHEASPGPRFTVEPVTALPVHLLAVGCRDRHPLGQLPRAGELDARWHHRAERRRGRDRGARHGQWRCRRARHRGLARGDDVARAPGLPRAVESGRLVPCCRPRGRDRTPRSRSRRRSTSAPIPGRASTTCGSASCGVARVVRVADQLLVELDADGRPGRLLARWACRRSRASRTELTSRAVAPLACR